jgi:hypothetical protein
VWVRSLVGAKETTGSRSHMIHPRFKTFVYEFFTESFNTCVHDMLKKIISTWCQSKFIIRNLHYNPELTLQTQKHAKREIFLSCSRAFGACSDFCLKSLNIFEGWPMAYRCHPAASPPPTAAIGMNIWDKNRKYSNLESENVSAARVWWQKRGWRVLLYSIARC